MEMLISFHFALSTLSHTAYTLTMTQQGAQVDKNVGPQGISGGPRTGMELLPLLQNCYLSKSVTRHVCTNYCDDPLPVGMVWDMGTGCKWFSLNSSCVRLCMFMYASHVHTQCHALTHTYTESRLHEGWLPHHDRNNPRTK